MAAKGQPPARALSKRREATRWVRQVRSAARAGVSPFDLDAQLGHGAYAFVVATYGMSLGEAAAKRLRDEEPTPKGLKTVFDFDGTVEELEAHNRELRERASRKAPAAPPAPIIVSRQATPRSRGQHSQPVRIRGSRRSISRACSRGGDGGDSDGDGPGGAGLAKPSKEARRAFRRSDR